jgi:arabinogalactan oligomer/maltooligosaccharide transport system permease protein
MINQKALPAKEKFIPVTPETDSRKLHSMKARNILLNTASYLLLAFLSIVWVLPIVGVVYTSLRNEPDQGTSLYPEKGLTFNNYTNLLTSTTYPFLKWFANTLIVAIFTMLISTIFVLAVAYTMSRLRFKSRKRMMNINLILGMFPGFMSMIAIYNILKAVGISGTLASLVLIYSAASGSGFYIAKGFFDTVSKSLDEAARIDGANNAKVFFKIILPLSKPIVVYTILTSFMGPWMDYIFSSVILRDKIDNYTVALGLYNMISTRQGMVDNFTMFFAGSVMISIPIMILFLFTQKYYVAGVTGGSVKG